MSDTFVEKRADHTHEGQASPDALAVAEADAAAIASAPELAAALELPAVAALARPCVSLEVVAIAAAVFALMQSLLWLPLPVELVWVALVVLGAKRRGLYDRGQDIVFAQVRRRRCAR